MPTEYENLYALCLSLFGKDQVSREDLEDPAGIEITIHINNAQDIEQVTLALYRGDNPQAFMHINDFTFEYDSDEKRAIDEMKKYLQALNQGKVHVHSIKFLGMRINRKIVIED